MGCDAEDLSSTIHPHPTLSETVAFAAEAFEGTITDLYLPKKKKNSTSQCKEAKYLWFKKELDSHEFYRVIPNVCEGCYKFSALFEISPLGRDHMLQSILSASYEI